MSSKMMLEAVVQDVEVRKIAKKDGSGDLTLYDVVLGDGTKWTAFEKDLAERAWKTKGTMSILEVTVEQKGNFTNRNLRGIQVKPTSGFGPAMSAMDAQIGNGGGSPEPTGNPFFSAEASPQFTQKALVEEPSYKDRTIWRQTAAKVAANIAKTETEFWATVDVLVSYFETGVKPNTAQVAVSHTATSSSDPFADMQQQQPPHDDLDIPF